MRRESHKIIGRLANCGENVVRMKIVIAGSVILLLGAVLITCGQIWRYQIEGLVVTKDWAVTWYHITDQLGDWGSQMGPDTKSFYFDTGGASQGIAYAGESVHLGFKATTTIDLTQDTTLTFVIGSGDGSILKIDGKEVINMWHIQGYTTSRQDVQLTKGTHTLEMQYYKWEADGEASFELILPGWQNSVYVMVGGIFLLALGVIIAILGLRLKPQMTKS